jgi:iron complex outermembrane recepter protein
MYKSFEAGGIMSLPAKLLWLVIPTSLAIAASVQAEVAAGGSSTVTSSGGTAASDASTSEPPESDSSKLKEIIVTAQRRSERLQDVPITITSLNAERLEKAGIESVSQLAQVVPAFRVDYTGTFAQPSIRGVGTSVAGVGTGSAVGIYIDGFYLASPQTTDFNFLNVSNIQVLKGPQGTLFGRNTTAGAVLVTTTEPSTTPELSGRVSYGRYNSLETATYGTMGFTGQIAGELGVLYDRGDGFQRDIVTGSDVGRYHNISVRPGLKIELNDDGTSSILLRYMHTDTNDPTFTLGSVYHGLSTVNLLFPDTPIAARRGDTSLNQSGFSAKTDAAYLTGKFDLGFANLTSYSMYRHEIVRQSGDFDGSPLHIFDYDFLSTDINITQELDLNSKPGGPWSWVTGFYFYREQAGWPNFHTSVFGLPLTNVWNTLNTVTSYAVFGDTTYEVVPQLFLTAGLRYSYEKNHDYYNLHVPDATSGQPAGYYPASDDWNSVTPRAVVRYQLDGSSSVYASYGQGFKSGLLNANGLTTQPVAPEKISAYEVGYKLADGPAQFNTSAFYYKYTDLQIATYNGALIDVTNAAKSKVYGAEFDFSTKVSEHVTFSAGIADTHATYDRYPNAPRYSQERDPTNPAFGLFVTAPSDASGNTMQRAPRFSGNVTLGYRANVFRGPLDVNANYAYQSKTYFEPANQFAQGGYGLLNLRATWTEPTGHWSFSLFGNNVTNTNYLRAIFESPFSIQQFYGEPAVYGGSVSFNY